MMRVEVVMEKQVRPARLEEVVAEYKKILELEKLLKKVKEELKAEIIQQVGEEGFVDLGNVKVEVRKQKRSYLKTNDVKKLLSEMGVLDKYTYEREVVSIYVR